LNGARIGVAREIYVGYNANADSVANSAIKKMHDLGAKIIDPANIPSAKQMLNSDSEMTVLFHEFKHDINQYLSQLATSSVRTLKDIIDFNEAHRNDELKYSGQELLMNAQETTSLEDAKYLRALEEDRNLSRQKGIDAVMDEHNLDALLMPSNSPPWAIDLIYGDPMAGARSTQPAALAGYPAITVPAGFVFGLPVGITLIGRAYSEPVLIKLAYAFEQSTLVRIPPKFLPTVT